MRTATQRRLTVALIAVLLATAAVAAQPGIAHGEDHGERLTNLAHLDLLYDPVTPPDQTGHDTYRLEEEPEIGMLWTYAEPDDGGDYVVVGGGAYDPATDTWGQGAFNADDVSRAAIVYLRHWGQFGDDHSRERAYQLLRGLAYLQTIDGSNAGNVVLWMQPDGTLTPSAEPIEFPDPSDSDASYWLARTIWAFGEGYAAFVDADPDFAAFLDARLTLALEAVDRQVIEPSYGTYQVVDGLEWPAWLIADGADASAEAVYGLVAYDAAGGTAPDAEKLLVQLAEGIAAMQLGDATTWPFGALMPWAGSRSVWHAWGDQMAGALAAAAELTGRGDWAQQAAEVAATFTPHLLAQGGPDHSWMPTPAERSQIAYGVDATLQNLVRTAALSDDDGFRDLASFAGSWYFGNNPAGIAMYDPDTGRTFDGVTFDGDVNRNAGAESTIHGLLSMLVLDADPGLAARSRDAVREEHVTWRLYEAEAGVLGGNARIVEPDEAWTGESLWSGGAYVELGSGDQVTLDVDLPVRDVYLVMPVFHRQEIPERSVQTRFHLAEHPAGIVAHGGAEGRGVTAMPGYLDIGTTATRTSVGPGATTLSVRGINAQDQHAALDAVHVMPAVEWLVLAGPNGGQALLRSFADRQTTRSITLPGATRLLAVAYDTSGHEVARVTLDGDRIDAPVMPGGFTVVRSVGVCPGPRDAPMFPDVLAGAVHAHAIDCAAYHEIALGYADGTYRPVIGVRRDQMASFIVRTLETAGHTLPAPEHSFTDVTGGSHERAIGQLAAAGIALGRTPTSYAPTSMVTRDQMASYLVRALNWALDTTHTAPASPFTDIAGNTHEQAIHAAFDLGLTTGRTATSYDPRSDVRRDQMASFMIRLLTQVMRAD